MKRYMYSSLALILSVWMAAAFTSCKKDDKGDNGGGTTVACSNTGTLVSVTCGTSVLGGYWIQLDNGKLLQPCDFATDVKQGSYQAGQQVKFGYEVIAKGSCDNMIHCMSVTPPATKVRITCLEVQPFTECNTRGTIDRESDCDALVIRKDNNELLQPINQDELKGYKPGDIVFFSAHDVYTFVPTCGSGRAVMLDCLRPFGWCGTICYCQDITVGDDPKNGNPVNIVSARVEGDNLKIKAAFGGCSDHYEKLGLLWDGSWEKSNPAGVTLVLHDNSTEMCNAYFTHEVCFDLRKIRTSTGGVKIHLSGYEGPLSY